MRIAIILTAILLSSGCATRTIPPDVAATIDHNFRYLESEDKKLSERLSALEKNDKPKLPTSK
jgi:hypothetical protein